MSYGLVVKPSKAHQLMDKLEDRKIDYLVWNIFETFEDSNSDFEIEFESRSHLSQAIEILETL